MKLQNNQSMRVFLDEDYSNIQKQVESEYIDFIEGCEIGYSYIDFEINYPFDDLNLYLKGRLEVHVTYDERDGYSIDSKINSIFLYDVTDVDCERIETDFNPLKLILW